jgi:hypothetical protein
MQKLIITIALVLVAAAGSNSVSAAEGRRGQDPVQDKVLIDVEVGARLAEEIDEVRDELGDTKFDLLFGSSNSDQDHVIPVDQR